MSTETTNYGFVKMDPGEPADVNIWNANLDAIDSEIEAIGDTSVYHWERWAWEGSRLCGSSPFSQTNLADGFGGTWVQYDSEGNLPSAMDFGASGVNGEFSLTEGVWRIYFNVYLTGIPTSATEGGIQIRLDVDAGSAFVAAYTDPMEIFSGTQRISAEWLLDVRSDGTGDMVAGVTHNFAIKQVNSTSTNITITGGVQDFDTMAVFELVRN